MFTPKTRVVGIARELASAERALTAAQSKERELRAGRDAHALAEKEVARLQRLVEKLDERLGSFVREEPPEGEAARWLDELERHPDEPQTGVVHRTFDPARFPTCTKEKPCDRVTPVAVYEDWHVIECRYHGPNTERCHHGQFKGRNCSACEAEEWGAIAQR